MNNIIISLYDLLNSLSSAQDLVNSELSNHHHQVAYLSYRIAELLNIPPQEQKDIILAGLLHDIGALTLNEKLSLIDDDSSAANNHGYLGCKLISGFAPLNEASKIIKYHHHHWNNGLGEYVGNQQIPLGSHILHIADRACVMLDKNLPAIPQIPNILKRIANKSGTVFMPTLVDAITELGNMEYIWLDLLYKSPLDRLTYFTFTNSTLLGLDQILDFSVIFSRIIDFRSRFTANHSAGVAKIAYHLAKMMGHCENECKMMQIAGYLHDLGKLAVDKSILEKPDKLTFDELSIIKCHPFYTYRILEVINGFETISTWAAYHHERPNGTGYPFHLDNDNLPLGSKIIATADVFNAIIEDRPYRKGMNDSQVVEVLFKMKHEGALCPTVVSVLLSNFSALKDLVKSAQETADKEYSDFMVNITGKQ